MKILGLPGINPVTEQWMQKLLGAIEPDQADIVIQRYQCWGMPGTSLDIETEAGIAAKTGPDIVIAKSIGTRVALYSFMRNLNPAKACIFLGIPIRGCSNDEISALHKLCKSVPTLLIQQTNDPVGGYSVLASLLPTSPACKTIEVPGNDHRYGNIDQLRQIIESWYSGIGS